MPEDEFRLIQLAQRGDAEACAALYSRHYDAVYRYCYYRLGDSSLAEDLAGEVFVRMVEKLDTFQLRGRPLLAWLYTISRNLVADVHRDKGKAVHVSLQEGIPNAVVEAMASGLPIIVGKVSDLPLIVSKGHNGYVCDERDVESISDAMQRMLNTTPDDRAAMGSRSRKLAVDWFARERFVEDYERLYAEVTGKT